MERYIEMSMKKIKVKYISDKKSIFFKKGEIYEATLPKDEQSGKYFVFSIDGMDEPGEYALPSSMFEKVSDHEHQNNQQHHQSPRRS